MASSSNNQNTIEIPEWITKIDSAAIQKIGNIQMSICKKNEAIRKLEQHRDNETAPNSLKITINVTVSKEKQTQMDEILKQATVTFQKTIIESLIQVRLDERKELEDDQKKIVNQRNEVINLTCTQLSSEGIETRPSIVSIAGTKFQNLTESAIRVAKEKDFHRRKALIEKKEKQKAAREEARIEEELRDPVVQNLEKKILNLEKIMKTKQNSKQSSKNKKQNSKNRTAKPMKTAHRRGKQNISRTTKPKNTHRNNSRAKNTRTNVHTNERNPGRGNRKHRYASRTSTRRSGEKSKPFPRRRN